MPCLIPLFCTTVAAAQPIQPATPYSDVGLRVNGSHRAIGGTSYSNVQATYYAINPRTGTRYPVYLYPAE